MNGINYIAPGETGSKYLSYTTQDGPIGGFWIVVTTDKGEMSVFISQQFIKDEVLPRLDVIPLGKRKG